jgi:hypothetical protein
MLVRKGPLQQASSDPPFRTPLGWAAKAIRWPGGRQITRHMKRLLKAKRRGK